MNILNFINSKDIREHLKTINYEFNSLETAWLIYQCAGFTIKDRHAAWQELVKTMPDCKIEERMNTTAHNSLHDYLRKYIDYEENILAEFFASTENWLYTVEWFEQGSWFSNDKFYKTFEKAQNELLEEFKEWEVKYDYRITKQKIESKKHIRVCFDTNNQPYDYDISEYPEELTEVLYGVFEGLWFDFPTPFEKGDILCQYNSDGEETSGFCQGPFVVKGVTPENVSEWTRKDGDTSDMNAWGYFQDPDGTIYYEVMHNYMNLEYYRSELTGKNRILKALGNFLKGEIDIELMCRAYHYLMCDEYTKNSIPQGFTDEALKLAGVIE